ncbi:hypothetical protein HK097_004611 [Rhizophlyctis rosea]|uniref:Uncharacterized protein n=1 Tax=Rhizophlyctis rosea TaxID=64517 RepID=A0AAD5X656_9FUNG|nr:hypothetical protein HK097_004611 [Rhizophlyctis rosea]
MSDFKFLFVGTGGKHVHTLVREPGTFHFTRASKVESNTPSWISVHPTLPVLYSVNELENTSSNPPNGTISSFRFDKETGKLTFLNRISSGGAWPAHLDVHPEGKYIGGVNYFSGSIFVAPINADGSLGEIVHKETYSGSGPRTDRQESSHPHQFVWRQTAEGAWTIYVPDLGSDKIQRAYFGLASSKFTPTSFVAAPAAGSGPRHIAFHPTHSVAYVIHELSNTVSVHTVDKSTGDLSAPLQNINFLLSAEQLPPMNAAEITVSPNGKFLYVSQRGQDFIASLKIGAEGKSLEVASHYKLGGKLPRHFTVHGNLVFVGSQEGENSKIEVLKVDHETGKFEEFFFLGIDEEPQSIIAW